MSNAGPQFPTKQEMHPHSVLGHTPSEGKGGTDPSGRFRGEYMSYHLDPSGGINHSGSFGSPEEAHKWASTNAVAGSGSHADASGGPHGMLNAYEIHRRTADSHTGTNSSWSKFDAGHLTVQPLKAGDKPESRTVLSNRVNGFDGERFRQQSSTNWKAQTETAAKKRQDPAKGK